jgi:hypothetical protein
MVKVIGDKKYWFFKGFDFKHGYGYFCQIYYGYKIGFGFSKNKFRCVKNALKDLYSLNNNTKEI